MVSKSQILCKNLTKLGLERRGDKSRDRQFLGLANVRYKCS